MFKSSLKGVKQCLNRSVKGVGKFINKRVSKMLARRNRNMDEKKSKKARAGTAQQKPNPANTTTTTTLENDKSSRSEETKLAEKLTPAVTKDQHIQQKNESLLHEEL